MPLTQQQQLQVSSTASEKLKDLRAEHLLCCLNQVAADFPPEVLNRGINRNWNDYRYILKHLAGASFARRLRVPRLISTLVPEPELFR